jgi:2-polyprenyl-6-hydroxyphenyl methylase/3-demethylubiquinone-9 3-methyltransferase
VWELLAPGGVAIISAPYHGYTKNLLISLTNQWDSHLNPFYPGTMVRFFSEKTYGRLWREAGFEDVSIRHAGRVPLIAKSMIAILKKH